MQNSHSRPHLQQNRDYLWDPIVWARSAAGDNTETIDRLHRNLHKAVSEELTPRQRQILILLYGHRLSRAEIARELHVSRSTVTRAIQRSHRRLRRFLQYSL